MLPYTLDNHFSFGYGSGMFNPEQRSTQNKFWCSYVRARTEPADFKTEVIRVARILSEEAVRLNRTPFVMLSGGMDSEVTAKGFIEAGVAFEAITFRYKNNLNIHELRFVDRFVRRHKLKHRYLDIDVLQWIKTAEAEDFIAGSKAASLVLLSHMKLMSHIWENLNGFPVLGNGDVYLENSNGWNYVELEYMLAWYRHALRFNILGGIGFFQHTPEVTLAMLRHPRIEKLGRNENIYANRAYNTSRFVKYGVYRECWPDLETRPKFTGSELVQYEFDIRGKELIRDSDKWLDKWVIGYDDFRSMLEPNEQVFRQNAGLPPRETAGQLIIGN